MQTTLSAQDAVILGIDETHRAPVTRAGWTALQALLSDGQRHFRDECLTTLQNAGMAQPSACALLLAATRLGALQRHESKRPGSYRSRGQRVPFRRPVITYSAVTR